MKYSIFIHQKTENASTVTTALHFIQALLRKNHHVTGVFFYGHAVKCAFEQHHQWQNLAEQGVTLTACSTIADDYLNKGQKPLNHIKIAGLGQWMQAHLSADKRIEFL